MQRMFPSQQDFTLFGDLHVNDKHYAVCCEEAGADAVLFHLSQDSLHGGRFGGLELEEGSLRDAISVLKIPAGISIGDSRPLLPEEWESVVSLGFAFVNMYAHHLPSFIWLDSRIDKLVSIGPGYILEQVKALSEFDKISGILAALTPNQGIGMPLTLLDVTTLRVISRLSSRPIFVPTQRKIRPQDINLLKEQGCRGLFVSSIVYGETEQSCRDQIALFRSEISSAKQMNSPQSFTN
ncbi:MAG: hypothetical protein JRN20_19095 [Nitrososphaerota archaeon]|nr:hypothetical protein [Nitrososphaerota archaeon]